ncbi:hypothetical protein Q5P01_018092 [Channa striata]|uniref:Glutathione S-transferase n=1 Tax=Channa striata TaxID=64152 RepID=A0AA88M420_CHASR|nr:hypothetical protein Q5P01_018092 [Channa striata]
MISLEEKKLQGHKHKLLAFEKRRAQISGTKNVNVNYNVFAFCQIPAFKHGDNIVNESAAACLYLEFKSQGNKLIPDTAAEQAVMYQRMMEGLTLTEKLNSTIYYEWFIPEQERHESAVRRNREALTAELKLWEGYLQNFPPFGLCIQVAAGSYLAGAFSLADVIVFPNIACALRFGPSVERYPKLAKYYSLLKDRPSIKNTWPPHWLPSPQGYDTLKNI